MIDAQIQLPITFFSDLTCNKTLKARNSTHRDTISNLWYSYCALTPNKKWYKNIMCWFQISKMLNAIFITLYQTLNT